MDAGDHVVGVALLSWTDDNPYKSCNGLASCIRMASGSALLAVPGWPP